MRLNRRIGHGIISLILTLTLVMSVPFAMPIHSYASGNFPDTTGHWAERFISRAYNLGIVNGYTGGRFMPDKAVTRAEFVSMVNKALDLDTDASSNFTDVRGGHWFYEDVSEAVAATYASGYSDNTFRPNNPISRQEAAVMLSRILPSYKEKGNLKIYRDYRLIASWAAGAMEKMTGRKYMGAYNDGRIHPADPLTRAQTAKILCDILDNETFVRRHTRIDEDDTKLTERVYVGDVLIDEDLGEGSATLDNCVVLGTLTVEGGGSKSITINNSRIANMVIRKDDTPVRIVTKGNTVIPKVTASRASILQTSGKDGSGMPEITVNKGADLTLKGNFPVVNIVGSAATVALESGKINTLTVTKAGRYSDITLTGKAEITEAIVNSEAYFHGTGTIVHMSVNADDITYETKPKKMTVGVDIDRATGEADNNSDVDVEFEPGNKDDDVDLDTKITLTFDSSMKLAKGTAISNTNIKDFVSVHTASKGGILVEFTATINSAKKVITITPVNELSANTRYYVVLADKALKNAAGSENDDEYIYFTTGTSGGSTTATYRPANGSTGVSASTSITIDFPGDVVKYSDGTAVTSAYLQDCIQFRAGGSGGAAVAFTVSISSADRITITPSTSLTAGQSYYVAIVANKLKAKDGGKAVPGSSATWTVAPAAPQVTNATLSTLTLAPSGESNVLTGFSSSTSNYSVSVPFGTTSVDVTATAASGTAVTINGTATTSAVNIPVNGSTITPINISAAASGMTTTSYTVNVQVAGNTSLSVISVHGAYLDPALDNFTINLLLGENRLFVLAYSVDPAARITIGSETGTGMLDGSINLVPGYQAVTFTVRSNMTTKTYTIYISRYDF